MINLYFTFKTYKKPQLAHMKHWQRETAEISEKTLENVVFIGYFIAPRLHHLAV